MANIAIFEDRKEFIDLVQHTLLDSAHHVLAVARDIRDSHDALRELANGTLKVDAMLLDGSLGSESEQPTFTYNFPDSLHEMPKLQVLRMFTRGRKPKYDVIVPPDAEAILMGRDSRQIVAIKYALGLDITTIGTSGQTMLENSTIVDYDLTKAGTSRLVPLLDYLDSGVISPIIRDLVSLG